MLLRGKRQRRPIPDVKDHYFPFDGGLNLVDAPLSVKQGMVIGAINYEQRVRGGYRRIEGHERFDGQSSPSDASYWILNFDSGNVIAPAVGATVQGVTSGAKGKLNLVVLESGAWDGTGAGYLVLVRVTGDFQDNESLVSTNANDGFDNGFSNGFG